MKTYKMQSGRTPQIGLRDGLAAMRIAKAAQRSVAEGRVVRMSEFSDMIL